MSLSEGLLHGGAVRQAERLAARGSFLGELFKATPRPAVSGRQFYRRLRAQSEAAKAREGAKTEHLELLKAHRGQLAPAKAVQSVADS